MICQGQEKIDLCRVHYDLTQESFLTWPELPIGLHSAINVLG